MRQGCLREYHCREKGREVKEILPAVQTYVMAGFKYLVI
jgi:hypothetical protein